jgi:hypothetical protein
MVVDSDAFPPKSSAPQGHSGSMLKVLPNVEASPRNSQVDLPANEQDILARDRERKKEFQRQI